MKEKTMPYSFSIHYIKGAKNYADLFSRYPATLPDTDDIKSSETIEIASIIMVNSISASIAITEEMFLKNRRRPSVSKGFAKSKTESICRKFIT